ncbi:protocatechuate 3,4-dioxygenase subunit alpha [Blastococcus atacamensis]|uniref:protocatechuate 3,4-dioxygenase subunit alpha n=1 Tax=Blastococcus atacamensis TaxID=2070508 RepID=UPI000CEC3A97|nr:protocatechuate 3,4-dioxygenase subunit alpha [Blastococcus atacamensis]
MTIDPLDVPDVTEPYQPLPGRSRSTGFLTEPLRLGTSPSATVGPYLAIGLTWPDGTWAADEGVEGGIWVRGRIFDGADQVVPDAMVETWQADPDGGFPSPEDPRGASSYPGFRGYSRVATAQPPGEFAVHTLKPGRVPDGEGGLQAPHIDVSIFARGLLDRVVTRIYFADEAEANAEDVVLRGLPEDRRATLVAEPTQDGYRLDIHLQGEHETVFFAV